MSGIWRLFAPRLLIEIKRQFDDETSWGIAMRVRVGQPAPLPHLPPGYRYGLLNSSNFRKIIEFFNSEREFPRSTPWSETLFWREALSWTVPGGAITIADDDGNLVAFGALWRDSVPRYGRIMYVLVARRHRRRGLGEMVVRRLLGIAAESNLKWVVLMTQSSRPHAIRLYGSVGFSILTRRQRAFVWLKGAFSRKLLQVAPWRPRPADLCPTKQLLDRF
jgi:ribosomal protein S18 acetylase RimI-like enzyme